MRHIDFDPSALSGDRRGEWEKWLDRATTADDKYRAADDKYRAAISVGAEEVEPEFQASIWADLKKWLLQHVFSGKCAYCEVMITDGFFGEAEHYRPKSEVTTEVGGKAVIVTQADGLPHPGYYWLAYDWRNLLPSCQLCNNAKSSQFPIAGKRVFSPEEGSDPAALDEIEEPLLLNPYRDHPEKHLKFGVDGQIAHLSPEGRNSIEVYELDRGVLSDVRGRRQQEARDKLAAAVYDRIRHDISIEEGMRNFTGKDAVYSAAVADYLDEVQAQVLEELATAMRRENCAKAGGGIRNPEAGTAQPQSLVRMDTR